MSKLKPNKKPWKAWFFFSCRVCVLWTLLPLLWLLSDTPSVFLVHLSQEENREVLMSSLICQIRHFVWIFRLCAWLQILQENVAMTTLNTLSDSLVPKLETGKEDEILLHYRVWAASIFGPLQSPLSLLVLLVFAAVMQSAQLWLCIIKKMIKNAV